VNVVGESRPGAPPRPDTSPRTLWSVAREAIVAFFDESPFELAAALSFYTLLSLSPLVLLVVGVTGLVWSEHGVREHLVGEIRDLVGPAGAETVKTVLAHASDPGRSALSIVVGIVTLLIGATTVFGQLQAALNQIWNVKAAPGRALWSLIRTRLLSLALVLVLGFLLLVSLLMSAALAAVQSYLSHAIPAGGLIWQGTNFLVTLGVVTLLIAMIFKVLPDVRVTWSYVWFGAVVTSVLFGLGRFVIGFYLGHATIASSYGAAGSLVVFLVWVYYSSLILLFGAKLTQVYARWHGADFAPAPHAVSATP
jgi:membrane protein